MYTYGTVLGGKRSG